MSGPVDLVFEGGGVKGVGLVGAYAELAAQGWEAHCVAGASAGAIVAALVAAGYSAEDLERILLDTPFASFKDEGWEDKVPLVGKQVSLLRDLGMYEGKAFREWMDGLLREQGVRTFGDLRPTGEGDPRRLHRLQVIASDVTARRLLVLPRDAHRLGTTPEDLEVVEAVRMSMSIPIFFEPVRWKNADTDREHLIVDGGILSNFPVWLFDAEGRPPRFPTFGLLLVEGDPRTPPGDRLAAHEEDEVSLLGYLKALARTMMEAHDRRHLEEADYARTIPIPTLGVGTTDFDLTRARARALYESGREAARRFLDSWSFEDYVAAFREDPERAPTRREGLEAAIAALRGGGAP